MEFKLEIKNLALSDSRGHDLQKDIVVRVTSRGSKQAGGVFSVSLSFSVTQLKKLSCHSHAFRFGCGPKPNLLTASF